MLQAAAEGGPISSTQPPDSEVCDDTIAAADLPYIAGIYCDSYLGRDNQYQPKLQQSRLPGLHLTACKVATILVSWSFAVPWCWGQVQDSVRMAWSISNTVGTAVQPSPVLCTMDACDRKWPRQCHLMALQTFTGGQE